MHLTDILSSMKILPRSLALLLGVGFPTLVLVQWSREIWGWPFGDVPHQDGWAWLALTSSVMAILFVLLGRVLWRMAGEI